MTHLTPIKRPDRNGKLVTRHVKASTAPGGASSLPAPQSPQPVAKSREDTVRSILDKHLSEVGVRSVDDVEGYITYINRKAPPYRVAIMKAIEANPSGHQFNAVMAVVEDASMPSFGVLALDDPDFIVELARSAKGTLNDNATPKAFAGAVLVMDQTFRALLKTSTPVDEAGVAKYAPLLRAGSVSRTLGLDQQAASSFDEIDQIRHISDNIDTFMRHLGVCKKIVNELQVSVGDALTDQAGEPTPLDSYVLLEMCEILEDNPLAEDALITYVSERKRFVAEEFKDMASGPSSSLSSGTL